MANAAHPPLSLAPINADHSRSDFPARDLDFVSPGRCTEGEAEGAARWWPRKERRLAVGFPPPHSTIENGVTVMSVEAEAAV